MRFLSVVGALALLAGVWAARDLGDCSGYNVATYLLHDAALPDSSIKDLDKYHTWLNETYQVKNIPDNTTSGHRYAAAASFLDKIHLNITDADACFQLLMAPSENMTTFDSSAFDTEAKTDESGMSDSWSAAQMAVVTEGVSVATTAKVIVIVTEAAPRTYKNTWPGDPEGNWNGLGLNQNIGLEFQAPDKLDDISCDVTGYPKYQTVRDLIISNDIQLAVVSNNMSWNDIGDDMSGSFQRYETMDKLLEHLGMLVGLACVASAPRPKRAIAWWASVVLIWAVVILIFAFALLWEVFLTRQRKIKQRRSVDELAAEGQEGRSGKEPRRGPAYPIPISKVGGKPLWGKGAPRALAIKREELEKPATERLDQPAASPAEAALQRGLETLSPQPTGVVSDMTATAGPPPGSSVPPSAPARENSSSPAESSLLPSEEASGSPPRYESTQESESESESVSE